MGFIPGNEKEKAAPFERPYIGLAADLFDRGDAYSILKNKGIIEFETTSFLRGTTFNNAVILIDEAANMNDHEVHAGFTRIGENCRVICCGDYKQSDFFYDDEKLGFINLIKIVDKMKSFDHIRFTKEDCVRSGLVKEYLFAREDLGL
jgi:phosphate starvation-inducible PhoH-like protein